MSVTQSFELRLDFQNYWHTGSGQSSGHHLDALCQKDAAGLPYVSGRQLKGLLRHAVRRAEAWGWYDQAKQTLQLTGSNAIETVLFGSSSQDDSRFDSDPGMVFVDNAELAQDERTWLGQPEQTLVRSQLYVDMYNTAINAETANAIERRRALSAAKVQIGRSLRFVGQEAIQLHGGIGMTEEYAVGHYVRRGTILAQIFGDTAHHLARLVALGGLPRTA